MSCAYYLSDYNEWYWLEDEKLFGGYDNPEETAVEKYCIQGSDKYQQLKARELKPRIGDFVKDGISCGLVTRLDMQLNKRLGLIYYNGREDCFADYESVTWIAPCEWSDW